MKKTKNQIFKIQEGKLNQLFEIFLKKFGLPRINALLALYCRQGDRLLELKFYNDECFFRAYDKNSQLENELMKIYNSTPPIKIHNRNVKFFLKLLADLNQNTAYITDNVVDFSFLDGSQTRVLDINIGTPSGDLLVVRNGNDVPSEVLSAGLLEKELTTDDLDAGFENNVKPEKIFGDLNILNEKITRYSNRFGIDLSTLRDISLYDMMKLKSNDYDFLEKSIKSCLGLDVFEYSKIPYESRDNLHFFKPLSIVIAAYNANDTLPHTLRSIESQNLSPEKKKLIDVVIVDDGSKERIADFLDKYKTEFSFSIRVIRNEKNQGLSTARNIGATAARYDDLVFIDADILLASNFLYQTSCMLQLSPSSVYVAMKKNLDRDANASTIAQAAIGLPVPDSFTDKRVMRTFEKDQPWVNVVEKTSVILALDESDKFKNFGHGRVINGYDLASMVTGHNMSLTRKTFMRAKGFSLEFKGWGLEDAYFGARCIASGSFVIPLISTGVYHIDHPPRQISMEQQQKEYEYNLSVYEQLIKQNI